MASKNLDVLPAALRAASEVVAGHAVQVESSAAGSSNGPAEMSSVAAVALQSALDGYRGAFSQRLSTTSAALVSAADSFAAMEDTNSAMLASVAPGEQR
jgi:hypothetical protein